MRVLGILLATLVLVGCSGSPYTLEGAVEDHLPDPAKVGRVELDGSDPKGSSGVRATYGDEHVDVVVGPPEREVTLDRACAESFLECADLDTDVDGGQLVLVWQELEPEEDPGIIVLVMEYDDGFALVRWGGDITVTGDPRDLDLEVSVDDAVALLEDDRVRYDDGPAT